MEDKSLPVLTIGLELLCFCGAFVQFWSVQSFCLLWIRCGKVLWFQEFKHLFLYFMTFLFAGTLMIASCDTQLRPLCVLSLTVCLSFSYFTVWLRVTSYDWYLRETVDKSPRFLSMIWGSLTLGLCNIRGGGCVGWARVQLSAPALEDFP